MANNRTNQKSSRTRSQKKNKNQQSSNRKWWLIGALALLAVIAVIVIIVVVNNAKKQEDPDDTPNDEEQAEVADLGDDTTSFGEDLTAMGIYDGYFEEDAADVVVTFVSGTEGCYTLENNVLTFTSVAADSVYAISGKLKGNIVIDVGDDYKFDLELRGFSMVCNTINPITVLSGNEVTLTAKKDYANYIYDTREEIDSSNEALYAGAVHSKVDLEIAGKGSLVVVSENNNGIHSKDDLKVKNLTLLVYCSDNALKGNDSVTVEEGQLTLIAARGDGIKTSNSDISDKGNQRGTVTVAGGTHSIYAACDGIDASYDVIVRDGESSAVELNIYTDKYSNYSKEVTATSESTYYLKCSVSNASKYKFSVKYYNTDSDACRWIDLESPSMTTTSYYYYEFAKDTAYNKLAVYIYGSGQSQGQDSDYTAYSTALSHNSSNDTVYVYTSNGSWKFNWTSYQTTTSGGQGGHGGHGGAGSMNEGNSDKGEYSTKGIKACNEIVIESGTLRIKSYDDALHANNDTALENNAKPLGDVTVSGGNVTIYSNDDGMHADGALRVTAGTVSVIKSYEGLEGSTIEISGGYLSVTNTSDDGMNAGSKLTISGGTVYVYCTGDGLDSNGSILFSGGNTVVISNSTGNSCIDSESGYTYSGGSVVALMPSRGMTSEVSRHLPGASKTATMSLSANQYLIVTVGGLTATVKMPCSISAYVVALGDKSASFSSAEESSASFDSNGVNWR